MFRRLIMPILCFAASCLAQDRFQSGEFKRFTKSPTEHIIVRLDEQITVSTVHGTITFRDEDDPLDEVVFEIRGPGNSVRIRATRSDKEGKFNLVHVPEGMYVFKATKNGFQSVEGTLVVSKNASPQKVIKIEMPIGV